MLNTKLFDHTILKADATEAQVAKICDEALAHDFASVCVNQYYTKFVAEKLKGSDVKVCTDRKSTRLNSSHNRESRMPSSA